VDETGLMPGDGPSIRVRYWAAAKSAAGVAEDRLPTETPLTLADVRDRAIGLHPGTRLGEVLAACSALVGDRPVGSVPPDLVTVQPGSTVEFLPPFAGG
jgi:molybdopterin synthase sulfur carrier subunit